MAHKPNERFASAAEAAKALEEIVRPQPAPASPNVPAPKSATIVTGPVTTPPTPEIIHVEPEYPAWFAPLARLAEQRPVAAMTAIASTLFLTFVAGVLLGRMF